jgi:hypothetical protein
MQISKIQAFVIAFLNSGLKAAFLYLIFIFILDLSKQIQAIIIYLYPSYYLLQFYIVLEHMLFTFVIPQIILIFLLLIINLS